MFSADSRADSVPPASAADAVALTTAVPAAGRELTLTGIDLADIDPARFLPEHRVDVAAARFIGNTAAESLPFADGSFDVVVSQYGLEYADLALALSEAVRVLASGGQRRRARDLLSACLSERRLAQVEQAFGAGPWSDAVISSLSVGAAGDSVGKLVHAVRL